MRAPNVARAAESTASPDAGMEEGRSTVDAAEIAHFAAMADEWWDPAGKFRPLHQLNPIRLGFIRDQVAARFGRDIATPRPFAGLRLLDIGCGGGLLAEPLTRLGADVVGVDAAEQNISVAQQHALAGGLAIDYRHDRAEALAARGERFDIVLAMEVLEHVADVAAFLTACSTLLKPGGIMVLATLNRTPRSFALAIVGAEYIMRWLPRGTHTWSKFIRPHEMAHGLRRAGLSLDLLAGMQYRPLAGSWSIGHDLEVNYLALASKPVL